MTFDQAMAACKSGRFVRNAKMSAKWKIFYDKATDGFYCLNPHTGSDYQFRPSDEDKLSKQWELVQ